jgi:hypothetical protein
MWKIKDPELKAKVNAFFGDEEINNAFTKNTDCYRYFRLSTNINKSCFTFAIDKDLMEFILDYDPDKWNPLSEFEPGFSGCYLVTREAGSTPVVDTAFFDKATNEWKPQNSTVIAFREIPAPYQSEETK